MSRKALSITVGIIGILSAFAMLLGMSVMGSLMADARSENLSGPGVDVFLRTPFPGDGDLIVLDVSARGGSRAGISRVHVKGDVETLADVAGDGADWGPVVRSGKTRGEETATVRFHVPDRVRPGESMHLTIYVDYVVAMSSGSGTFENDARNDVVTLDVKVFTPAGRRWAQVGLAGRALGIFLMWFFVVWGVYGLYARTEGSSARVDSNTAELEGIGLLMGFMGGGFLGYWCFARLLMAGLGTQSTFWAIVLTGAWLVLPLVWVWRRWRRRKAQVEQLGLPRAKVVNR